MPAAIAARLPWFCRGRRSGRRRRIPGGGAQHHVPGVVGGAVVDHHDLELVGRVVERHAGIDGAGDRLALVEGGHDDRQGGSSPTSRGGR